MVTVGGYNATQGKIVSQNLAFVSANVCALDAGAAGPFLVYDSRFGWSEDTDLGIECVQQ
jgi:hypothetical protein